MTYTKNEYAVCRSQGFEIEQNLDCCIERKFLSVKFGWHLTVEFQTMFVR